MSADYMVFVGTYTDPILFGTGKILKGKGVGIYTCRMDPESGELELMRTNSGITNPSYLAFDPTRSNLYAVNELKTYQNKPTGTVSSFSVDTKTGQLTFLNRKPTGGTDPCHLIVDKAGRHVLLANFMSGSISVFPIQPDGSLNDSSDFIQHHGSSIDEKRQQGPHAHAVTLDEANRYAFVPDLGLDKILIYKFDDTSGKLVPREAPSVSVKPGAGPRHVVFHPSSLYAYLVNELDSTVNCYQYNKKKTNLDFVQTISTLPKDFHGTSTCADLHVSPSGEFLYGSNRGHDSIVIYQIDGRTGRLATIGHESTRGRTPRNFAIDPRGRFLLAANQDSDSIVTFRIDSNSGKLHPTGQVLYIPTPVCVKIIQTTSL